MATLTNAPGFIFGYPRTQGRQINFVSTTYYYRQSNGARGSTNSISLIPNGAVIERIIVE